MDGIEKEHVVTYRQSLPQKLSNEICSVPCEILDLYLRMEQMIQIHVLYGQIFSCHLQPSPAADPRNDLYTNASLCEEIGKKFTKYLS